VLWLVAAVIVAAILAGLAVYNVVDRTVAGLGQVRIAVMPFRPPADDAAPDTIVNAILQGFGGTPAAVIGPTTTSRYAGTDADVRIGRDISQQVTRVLALQVSPERR
jgi:hypothetical protein